MNARISDTSINTPEKLDPIQATLKNSTPKLKNILNRQSTISAIFGVYDFMWGNPLLHSLPQYRYIALPVYKLFGGKYNPLISVPISFMVTDLIMHKMPINLLRCYLSETVSYKTLFNIDLVLSASWFAISLPVAIYKYIHQEKVVDDPHNEIKLPPNQSNEKLMTIPIKHKYMLFSDKLIINIKEQIVNQVLDSSRLIV